MEANRRSTSLRCVLVLLLVACAHRLAAQSAWTTTRVTTGATRDRLAPSIAIDSLEHLHILFTEGAPNQQFNLGVTALVRYLTNASGSFAGPATVDSAYLHYATALTIDSSGRLHLLDARGTSASTPLCIRHAATGNGTFGASSGVGNGACGTLSFGYPGAAVGPDGALHVTYEALDDIYYLRRSAGGVWSAPADISNNLMPDGASAISIAPDGGIHILYITGNYISLPSRTIFHVRDSAGGFTRPRELRTIPNLTGGFNSNIQGASIVADRQGTVHVVYTEAFATTPVTSALYYLRSTATGWTAPVAISDTALYNRVSVTADDNGNLHVAAERKVGGDWDVVYLTNASGGWSRFLDLTANDADDGLFAGSTRFLAVRDSIIAIAYYSHAWGERSEIGVARGSFHPLTRIVIPLDTIDLGAVLAGACRDTIFTVRSLNMIGRDSLTLRQVVRLGRDSSRFDVTLPAGSPTIGPRDSLRARIRFCPVDTGCLLVRVVLRAANGLTDTVVVKGCGLGPRLRISPDSIDIGAWYTGLRRDTSITIANDGGDSLLMRSTAVEGSGAASFRPVPASVRLGRLEAAGATITFVPSDTGRIAARIVYRSNGGDDTVHLRGRGIGPRLRTTRDTLDLGAVLTGRCGDTTVEIANVGGDSLCVLPAEMSGSGSPAFRIVGNGAITLGALTGSTLRIRFCPIDSGLAAARVILRSNGGGSGADTIHLRGRGIGPHLRLRPDTLDLAPVGVGLVGATTGIVIENDGGDSLLAGTAAIVGRGARHFALRAPLDSTRLGALEHRGGMVIFTPSDTGCFTARLILRANMNADTMVLRGCALPPAPRLAHDTIDFGLVRAGMARDSTIALRNMGAGWLHAGAPITAGGTATSFRVRAPLDSIELAPGDGMSITIGFSPQDTGCVASRLVIAGNGGEREVVLRGCGGAPMATLFPAELDLGRVPVDSCRSATLSVTNTGSFPLIVSDALFSAPWFRIVEPWPTHLLLAPGQTGRITISFCPTDTGEMVDQLRLTADVTGRQPGVMVRGTGVRGIWRLPSRIDFGDVPRGICRDTTVTLRNVGNGPIPLALVALPHPFGDRGFTITEPISPRMIPAGDSLLLPLRFCPSDLEIARDSLLLRTDGGHAGVEIAGRGISGTLAASALLLDFGEVEIGGQADATVMIGNVGAATVELDEQSLLPMAGAGPADAFSIIAPDKLPAGIAPGERLPVVLRFHPLAAGPDRALWRGHGDDGGIARVELRGVGIRRAATLGADTLRFRCVLVGEAPALPVIVRNAGTSPLTIRSYATDAGTFFSPPSIRNVVLAPGAVRVDSVRYLPGMAPARDTALLTVVTDGGTLSLTMVGEASIPPTVRSPDTLEFGTVTPGDTARRAIPLTNPSCRPARIDRVTLERGAFHLRAGAPERMIVTDAATDTLVAEFAPTAAGAGTALLRLELAGGEERRVLLVGTGAAPGLALRPRELDFAPADVDRSREIRRLAVINLGTEPATVTDAAVSGADSDAFIATAEAALPRELAPEGVDTLWIDVAFRPGHAGDISGSLRITPAIGDGVEASLRGRGDMPALELAGPLDLGAAIPGTIRRVADTLRIRNSGTRPVRIASLRMAGADSLFFAIDGTAPTSLAVGEEQRLGVLFAPEVARNYRATCLATIDNGATFGVELLGRATASARRSFWLDTASIAVGEEARLRLHASPPVAEDEGIHAYHVVIRLDRQALFPMPSDGGQSIHAEGEDRVAIEGRAAGGPIVGEVIGGVRLLGLASGVPLNEVALVDIMLDDEPGEPIGDGLVLLSGCDVGRGIRVEKRARISSIRPNPIDRAAMVTYHAPALTAPTLRLLSIAGVEALAIHLPTATGADQQAVLPIDGIADGVYVLELRARDDRTILPVVIAR